MVYFKLTKIEKNQILYIYIYIYIYRGHSIRGKTDPERRATCEHFCCGNTLSLVIKVEKTNTDVWFYSGEDHTVLKSKP